CDLRGGYRRDGGRALRGEAGQRPPRHEKVTRREITLPSRASTSTPTCPTCTSPTRRPRDGGRVRRRRHSPAQKVPSSGTDSFAIRIASSSPPRGFASHRSPR